MKNGFSISDITTVRDGAIMALMKRFGFRANEISKLDYKDVSIKNCCIELSGIEINQKSTYQSLLDWLSVRGDKPGALFISFSNRSKGKRLCFRAIKLIRSQHNVW